MGYKFAGVELRTYPTEAQWQKRKILLTDGNGHPIYEPVRSCELKWDLISVDDFSQLNSAYRNQGISGTIVDLPHWSGSVWAYRSYTGCVIEEPEVGAYFTQYISKVVLIVSKVID